MTGEESTETTHRWEAALGQLLFPLAVFAFVLLVIVGLAAIELLFEFLEWTATAVGEGV